MFKAEIVAGLIALGGFSLGAQAMTLELLQINYML